jgi:hypothetical protein
VLTDPRVTRLKKKKVTKLGGNGQKIEFSRPRRILLWNAEALSRNAKFDVIGTFPFASRLPLVPSSFMAG